MVFFTCVSDKNTLKLANGEAILENIGTGSVLFKAKNVADFM